MRRFTFLFFTISFCLIGYKVYTSSGGPITGVAGEPPFNETCAAPGCHSGSAVNGGGGIATIVCNDSLGNGATTYEPNHTYTVTLRISEGTKTRYGFEAIILKGSGTSATAIGTSIITDATNTQLFGGTKKYVVHKLAGIDFSGISGSWSFKWKAPNANNGPATIYAAFNATNKNNSPTGDQIYSQTLTLTGNGAFVGITLVADNALAKIYPSPASSQITFDLLNPSSIKIYNFDGREVKKVDMANYSATIDIQDLPKGFYFTVVSDAERTGTYKFIKQ